VFQAGFDARWELDFFGGVRHTVAAAAAEVTAAEESRRDVMVTLVAEVARRYLELRGYQRRLEVAQSNLRAQRDTCNLIGVRARAGLASELDVARSEAQLARTEATLPELEIPIANLIHRLGILLGKTPEALTAGLQTAAPIPPAPPEVPVGLPAELLCRRPDIRRAEADIAVQAARLGIARSERYPKIVISGLAGRQASDAGGLLLGLGNFFFIGPSIRLPIFNAGRIREQIKAQDERLNQAILRYENTVRLSLEEVENSLTAWQREGERRVRLDQAVVASRRAVELSLEVYKAGLADFLVVLEAQNALYANEDELPAATPRPPSIWWPFIRPSAAAGKDALKLDSTSTNHRGRNRDRRLERDSDSDFDPDSDPDPDPECFHACGCATGPWITAPKIAHMETLRLIPRSSGSGLQPGHFSIPAQ